MIFGYTTTVNETPQIVAKNGSQLMFITTTKSQANALSSTKKWIVLNFDMKSKDPPHMQTKQKLIAMPLISYILHSYRRVVSISFLDASDQLN